MAIVTLYFKAALAYSIAMTLPLDHPNISPPRFGVSRKLGPHSRVLIRGSVGGKVDGRSREGRFLRSFEHEIIKQLGASVTPAQRFIVRRAARAALRLELMDEELLQTGELSAYASRAYGALSNALRLNLRELGIKPPEPKPASLGDIMARHARPPKGAPP